MSDLPALRYARPDRLADALAALARPGACVYAGGTDLVVALAERRPWTRRVREIVDIKALAAARGITRAGAALRIGALVTADALATHAGVARHAPALAEAARLTAAPALRRRGTLGGNLATPRHAGDVTTALVALGAEVEIAEGRRVRIVHLVDFLATRDRPSPRPRLVLAVRVPRVPRSAFAKIAARPGFGRALAAVAVAVVGRRVTVALGGVRERPILAPATAAALRSDDDLAAALAEDGGVPTDERAAHRLRLTRVLALRAFARVRA